MDDNYTIAERYTLPSHGLLYDKPINCDIKIRSMTVRDEMRRLAPVTDGTMYRNMAEIIDSCLIDKPGISSYDMCAGDYQFLMHKLRIVTYGPEYKVECRCPLCHESEEHIVNLEDLTLRELAEFDREKELTLTLPASKKVVTLNIMTPRILDIIEKDAAKALKQSKINNATASNDFHVLFQLVHAINTVDGVKMNTVDKETFCQKLVGRDFNAVLNRLDAIEEKVGLGAVMNVHCNNCGYDMTTSFRITPEFFRPTTTN